MAARNGATERQTPAGAKGCVSRQTYRNQSQLALGYPGGGTHGSQGEDTRENILYL